MDAVIEKNNIDSYKMSLSERDEITKKLDEALKTNSIIPQNKVWNSSEYREKYSI